ncbi:MAG TPA: hypothetical protein VD997_06510 [Phycisphaerales bacterium]|nr:hypothetical protein [Phycisphaerales bacterium]
MATLPTDPAQLLAFVKGHGPTWIERAAELGLQPGQVAELEAALAATDAAWRRAFDLRRESEAATAAYYNEARFLYEASSAVVRTVRTNALNTGNESLYALAQIDAPRPRRREAPAPGQPHSVRWTLGPLGEVTLTWKSRNPRGVANVVYQITRSVQLIGERPGAEPPFESIGLAHGGRTFTDSTIPPGARTVQYRIRPVRGQQVGPASATVVVQFGRSEGDSAVRLAA